MLPEACHWVCWFWEPLGGTPGQINVRYCLWLVLDNLFGATKWSTVCGCLCWAWVCVGMAKLHTKAGFHQHWTQKQVSKRPNAPWDHLCLFLPDSCILGSGTERASDGTWVAWSRFLVIHQVWVSGIPQIDTDSNLVAVLGLRQVSKSPRIHQGQLLPAGYPQSTCRLLWWGVSESCHGESSSIYQAQTEQDLAMKAGLCTSWVCKGKMDPTLEPHNSICPLFWPPQEL